MAENQLMIDTSILIDYFRKTNKENSKLVSHFIKYEQIYISTVTEFEIINGATEKHMQFWDGMLPRFTILNFDSKAAREAAKIVARLKAKRKTIDKPDLFIAATAVAHDLRLDTLNTKHFVDIDNLKLL